MSTKYRVVVGEKGNEQGHIIDIDATTTKDACTALSREMAKYGSDGWGRIETNYNNGAPESWRRD